MQNLRYHVSKHRGWFLISRSYFTSANIADYLGSGSIERGLCGAEWIPCSWQSADVYAERFLTEAAARTWLSSQLLCV